MTCDRCKKPIAGEYTIWHSNPRWDGTYAVELRLCALCDDILSRIR